MVARATWKPKPSGISAEVLQAEFRIHLPRFKTPDIDTCASRAEEFNEYAGWTVPWPPTRSKSAEKYARLFLRHLPPGSDEIADTPIRAWVQEQGMWPSTAAAAVADHAVRAWLARQEAVDWQGVATLIALAATIDCRATTGRAPGFRTRGGPLCRFTCSVLGHLGTPQPIGAVSDAIQRRTGGNRVQKISKIAFYKT